MTVWRKSARAQKSLDKGGWETWPRSEHANTLTCFDIGEAPGRQTHLLAQEGRLRTLTITEWERLCGFPDGWTDGIPISARFTALGNCVHVGTGEWVADRLAALRVGGGEAFWVAVRPNLSRVADAAQWWRVVEGPVAPVIADAELVGAAVKLLPEPPWGPATWGEWTGAVRADTGRKGRALFLPLRQALTGLDHGPELAGLLPLIGPERARARLAGEFA